PLDSPNAHVVVRETAKQVAQERYAHEKDLGITTLDLGCHLIDLGLQLLRQVGGLSQCTNLRHVGIDLSNVRARGHRVGVCVSIWGIHVDLHRGIVRTDAYHWLASIRRRLVYSAPTCVAVKSKPSSATRTHSSSRAFASSSPGSSSSHLRRLVSFSHFR